MSNSPICPKCCTRMVNVSVLLDNPIYHCGCDFEPSLPSTPSPHIHGNCSFPRLPPVPGAPVKRPYEDNENYENYEDNEDYENYENYKNYQDNEDSMQIESNSSIIFVPSIPYLIFPTNFHSTKSVEEIVTLISETLNEIGVSFEFNNINAEYNAVFVKGADYTKFQIHIYNNEIQDNELGNELGNESGEKIVEAQRLSGNGFAFNSIFTEIKNAVLSELNISIPAVLNTSSASSASTASTDNLKSGSFSPRSLSAATLYALDDAIMAPLSEEDNKIYLESIKRMMLPDAFDESQVQGCKFLCDMISSNPNFHKQLITSGCIEILLRLSLSNNFLVCQHAVMGLSDLTKITPSSIKVIWDIMNANTNYSFIDFLFNQLVDGDYYTEPRRRHGVQLLVSMLDYAKNDYDIITPDVKLKLEKYREQRTQRSTGNPLNDNNLEECAKLIESFSVIILN